jgi:predicted nucleic acid-binding protein
MSTAMPVYVLDSFALLAFFRDEPVADTVERLLGQAQHGDIRLVMSVANLGEVFYRTMRDFGIERAEEVLGRMDEYPIELVDVDRDLALGAAYLKGSHRMAYADCFAAALARRLDAAVVTGDPDFRQVEHLVAVEWLQPGDAQ